MYGSTKTVSGSVQFRGPLSPEAVTRVIGYQNEPLMRALMGKIRRTRVEAEAMFLACKQFLIIAVMSDNGAAPNSLIDIAWHEFLVRTKDYREFCDEHLGQFVDHCPADTETERAECKVTFERTKNMALKLFGALASPCWTDTRVGCSTDCGARGDEVVVPQENNP